MSNASRGNGRTILVGETSNFTKSERLIYLIDLLKARGKVDREEAARACGVSERTLYRDIRSLARMHVPVVCDGAYMLNGEIATVSDVAASSADLKRLERMLNTFITAIRGGMPVEISMRKDHGTHRAYYLPRGIGLKRNGICLRVVECPRQRPFTIRLESVVRLAAVGESWADRL